MASMTCDIVTPAEVLFTSECYMVVVPGAEGEMGFMPGHAQLMSNLADGVVRIYSDATTVANRFALQGGYVQVTGEKVIVLADRAQSVDAIDADALRKQIADAESALTSADDATREMLEVDLAWFRTLEKASA